MMLLLRFLVVCVVLPGLALAQEKPPVIAVFGDSLSAGYGLPRGKGWVDLLRQRLRTQGYPHSVVNASVSGETSTGGKARITQVLSQHRPAMLILELGANDGLRGQSVESLKANLASIIRTSKKYRSGVILIGMRLPPNYGAAYTRAFESSFSALAKRHGLPLVPFLMEGFAHRREMFQADGIHPGEQAQTLMLETVWSVLYPLLTGTPE